mgnify:CR=1 FL=1
MLSIVNVLFFLFGIGVFSLGAFLQWGSRSYIDKIVKNEDLEQIFSFLNYNYISVALLCLGGFMILLSFFGLIGACCASKCALFFYELCLIIIFLVHLATLIYVLTAAPKLEREYKKWLNQSVDNMNSPNTSSVEKTQLCNAFKTLSEIFECCGANGPRDFTNDTVALNCCLDYEQGCGNKAVDALNSGATNIIFIPNGTILGFELIIILLVPFLIGRILRNAKKDEERRHQSYPANGGAQNFAFVPVVQPTNYVYSVPMSNGRKWEDNNNNNYFLILNSFQKKKLIN